MSERETHPEALPNYEKAVLPEAKIRYALTDPDKRRPFDALGFATEVGNWEELRDRIVKELPAHPARFVRATGWGDIHNVDMMIEGPSRKRAPVRTGWIYRVGEDHPRLVTLYVKTTEWSRMEREGTI